MFFNQQLNDFDTLQQFREDGRKTNELRNISCKLGIDPSSNGSCHFKMGITEVICQIRGPKEKENINSKSFINVFYSVAPFSSIDRKTQSKFDKETSEFAENVRISFENLIFSETISRSDIDIIVTVIQGDGSQKSAIFNAITMSLLDAGINTIQNQLFKKLKGISMKDISISSTVGLHNQQFLLEIIIFLDLTHQEQRQSSSELVITYLFRQKKIDFIQLKSSKINLKELEQLKSSAIQGCILIQSLLRQILLESSLKKLLCQR